MQLVERGHDLNPGHYDSKACDLNYSIKTWSNQFNALITQETS